MELEIWKEVRGYEGLYWISNLGRVKSSHRRMSDKATTEIKERLLSPQLNSTGYYQLYLCKNGSRIIHTLHRLLLAHFVPNPKNLPEINHINGIKSDNRIENLEWVSVSENRLHAIRTGLLKPAYGEKKARAKFTNEQAREVKKLLPDYNARQILFYLGMDCDDMKLRNGIAQIKRGYRYSKC